MFFFLETVGDAQKNWDKFINSIPKTVEQKSAETDFKLAGGDRLDKWKYFNLVDGLVNAYPQYSHDDIEQLTYQMVMNMLAYNKEKAYIASRDNEIKSKNN